MGFGVTGGVFGEQVFEVRGFAVPGFGFRVCGSGFHFRSSRFGVLEVWCFRGSGFCAPRIRDFLFWVRAFGCSGFGLGFSMLWASGTGIQVRGFVVPGFALAFRVRDNVVQGFGVGV